jgi:hypothetical protein
MREENAKVVNQRVHRVTYNASAAAKTPAAPPTSNILPVGKGNAGPGPSPVLRAAPAVPDAGPLGAGDVDKDPDDVCDALTIATAWINSILATSLLPNTLELTPRNEASGTNPDWVTVHVRSASVIVPCHLQFISAVQAPGNGSLRWNSHVDEPCFSVYGSQKE